MITIVDYGAGNIRSISNMLRALGIASKITGEAAEVAAAERLILPGVGHFDHGMGELSRRGVVTALGETVARGVPLLGICLGAQLLTRGSEEGSAAGLGFIAAETIGFDCARLGPTLKVPHIGWSDVWAVRENPLLATDDDEARFYHVHSFHIRCDEPASEFLHAHHGYDFVTGIGAGPVLGVQFHPEKSHRFGMALLSRFAAWSPGRWLTAPARSAA